MWIRALLASVLLIAGTVTTSTLHAQATAAARTCESLSTLQLRHATVVTARTVSPAAQAANAAPGTAPLEAPPHCEVRGISRPSSDSEITFEVWLPLTGWNGNYRQNGNGGFAGTINRAGLAGPLRRGYVTAATDNGHDAAKTPQGTFAVGHPEKVIDFGYRAVHDTAEQAKAIATALYGRPPSRSYFVGCSDGGREALMEAQRFPEDFDGIIAGAPANDWSHLFTSFVWNELALTKDEAHRIPAAKLPAIQRAVVAACDASDGLRDGLVSNPPACRFDAAVLACTGADGNECLTPAQLETLKALYAGPKNPRTGEQIYPGLVASGVEALTANWPLWIWGSAPGRSAQAGFGVSYYRDLVFEQSTWDIRSMNFDRDVRTSDRKVGPILDATNPDLRSFRARGGKLLQYHGWGDAAIAASSSIEYYEAVQSFMSTAPDPRSTSKSVDDFYRLFMIPGMAHCGGGVGPVRFGNDAAPAASASSDKDPERDIFTALERWVEQGIAPSRLIGAGPSPISPAETMTRPLCPYPQQAQYKGSGNTNDAANFVCALPAK
jgi:feruloyl esterase